MFTLSESFKYTVRILIIYVLYSNCQAYYIASVAFVSPVNIVQAKIRTNHLPDN